MRRLTQFLLAFLLLALSMWTLTSAPHSFYIVSSATLGSITAIYLSILAYLRKPSKLKRRSKRIWNLIFFHIVIQCLYIFEFCLVQLSLAGIIHDDFNTLGFFIGSISLTTALFVVNGQRKRLVRIFRKKNKK